MSAKGQGFSFDFMIAVSVFLLAIGLVFFYWQYSNLQLEETKILNDMFDKSVLASQVWFKTGVPQDWNESNVQDVGLKGDHEFSGIKMERLNSLGYQKFKSLAGLETYDVYYRLYNETNSTIYEFGNYPINSRNVVRLERYGLYNNSIAILEAIVWA